MRGRGKRGGTEDPHQAEGLRSRGDRRIREEDRRDGHPYGCPRRRPGAVANPEERVRRDSFSPQVQGFSRALRDAHSQAPHRHSRPDAQDGGRAHAHRPAGKRRREHPVEQSPTQVVEN